MSNQNTPPAGATFEAPNQSNAAPAGVTFEAPTQPPAGATFEAPNQTASPEDVAGTTTGFETPSNSAAGTGFAKEMVHPLSTVSNLINKIPIIGEKLAPKEGVTAFQKATTPGENAATPAEASAEKIGGGAADIVQFISGDEALASLGAAEKLGIAKKLLDTAKNSPRLAAILTHGLNAMRQGAVAGTQQYANGATPADALKTAGLATLLGAGVGTTIEGAGAAKEFLQGKFNPKYLQEPLQEGVRDIIAKGSKSVIPPAPEPNYVYRARDVGESGIPNVGGHAQATSDLSQAKTYAEPGQRAEGKAQEVVRLDLNKLKPEDYTSTKHPSGMDWVKFHRPIAENELTKITPELEANEAAAAANKPAEVAPPKSIREVAEHAGDRIMADAKADYNALDEATNGRFQRFRDRMEANRRKLMNLTDSEEDKATEASILKNQKATEDEMHDAFAEAKAKGINPDLIDRADANYRKAQALYDLDNAIKKSATGAHPGVSHPDLVKEAPETLDPKKFHARINAMYDSGRLDDALGSAKADELFDHSLKHAQDYDKILRNRKRALLYGGVGAASLGGSYFGAQHIGHLILGQ